MKKYEIEYLEKILKNAEINVFNIENLKFSLVDIDFLIGKGKKRKKEATEGELDLFAYSKEVVWLIEWTTERGLRTYDFDNFVRKIEILNEKRGNFNKLISKIEQKFHKKLLLNGEETRVIGLYVNPTFTEMQGKTLEQRLLPKHQKFIYIWDSDTLEYFGVICNTIRRFSKYELFSYFDVRPELVFSAKELEGRRGAPPYPAIKIEKGVFGYPTYTFKIQPLLLLERCYVLRNEGWRSDSFQRMVLPRKLANIREYILITKNTSFSNNIIISPSPEIDADQIVEETKDGQILIHMPFQFSSFCIVDGQHRLLAFTQDFYGQYEVKEKKNDEILRELSEKSEIITTLVKFSGDKEEILRKQATLFKDINYTQTKVKTDFIYNLLEIIEPLHPESLGNKVIKYLNKLEDGVLKDKIEVKSLPSYRGRIKRASVVKWGLADLVDLKKLFLNSLTSEKIKDESKKGRIDSYVKFCGDKLEKYFRCIKEVFEQKYKEKIWDYWRKTGFMLLSTSSIVGFLRLYRHFIKDNIVNNEEEIKNRLKAIKISFKRDEYMYTSSQWAKLEEAMFDNIRKKYPKFGEESLIKRSKKGK